jgi:alpha-galactosidase
MIMFGKYIAVIALSISLITARAAEGPLFPVHPLASAKKDIVHMAYGNGNDIVYLLKSGTFDVFNHKKAILFNGYGQVKINGKAISSKDYTARNYGMTRITDQFGAGKKYVITLTGAGLPEMKQVFYTYPKKGYFFLEITVRGKDLTSNYMAPLAGQFLPMGKDARTLFVPFDNDTFIRYNAKPFVKSMVNTSAELGVVYDNKSRAGIVAGSVEHGVWKTGVRTATGEGKLNQLEVWGGYTDERVTRDRIEHGQVTAAVLKSPRILAGYFADWRKGLEEYGKANRLMDPPYVFNWDKPTPVGWNSWGVMQEKLDYDKATKVVDFFADSLAGFRVGHTAFIDLDSYWDSMVKNGDDTLLKQFADYCKSKGLEPGIYWAPFADWGDKHKGNRKVEGSDYHYSDLWTKTGSGYHDLDGTRALDPTHPGTKQRIVYFINRFKACGYKMIKIDFLGHAAIEANQFYDPKVTTGMQAYRQGMEYLVDQLDSKMLVYAAISPSLATGRYVHSRRIACDAFETIEHTRYTLNSVNFGWWQTYLYNYIDADHVVFGNEPLGANRARLLSSVITGTLITGDDFSVQGNWSARARRLLQDEDLLRLLKNGKAFRPVEGNTGKNASEMFTRQIGPDVFLAVFNYGKKAKSYSINAGRIGLLPKARYKIRELLQNGAMPVAKAMKIRINGSDAMLFRFTELQN